MAKVEMLGFFEEMYLTDEIEQKRSFKDKCFALQAFLDDCDYRETGENEDVLQSEAFAKHGFMRRVALGGKVRRELGLIKTQIKEKLLEYGFSSGMGGTNYTVYAVLIKAAQPEASMMQVYADCGEHFGVSAKNVENKCRYACRNAQNLDKSLCTFYENVTVRDIVFKLAENVSKKHNVAAILQEYIQYFSESEI